MRWIEPSHFRPYWGSALPLGGTLRIALVAVVVGVCAGAVVVFNWSATRPANQANLPISAQTETAKSQSFSAEPKAVSTIIVRTEAVKSSAQPTSSDQAQDLTALNELKAKIWEAEVAQRNFAAGLPHCSELNGTNFYFYPQNRVLNLQDYHRSLENLVTQGAFNQETRRPWNKQEPTRDGHRCKNRRPPIRPTAPVPSAKTERATAAAMTGSLAMFAAIRRAFVFIG